MSELRTNSITIRGRSFTVSELTAKAMRESRKIIEKEPTRLEVYVAAQACVEPKLTEAELIEMPNIFAERLSTEAFRLTKDDESPKASPASG